jgi:hypothetical protein
MSRRQKAELIALMRRNESPALRLTVEEVFCRKGR